MTKESGHRRVLETESGSLRLYESWPKVVRQFAETSVLTGCLTPKSAQSYAAVVAKFLRWVKHEHDADYQVTTRQLVLDYMLVLSSTPAMHKTTLRTGATVHHQVKVLRNFWKWLILNGLASSNPINGLRGPKFKERELFALEPQEIGAVVKAAKKVGLTKMMRSMNDALVKLVADVGLRIDSEALRLKITDVVDGHGRIKDELIAGAKGRERRVPLTPVVKKALAHYLTQRDDASHWLFVSYYAEQPGHIERGRRRLSYDASVKALKKIAAIADIPPERVGWHGMRRTAATEAVEGGCHWLVINASFGWSKPETVQRYIRAAGRRSAVRIFREHTLMERMMKDGRLTAADVVVAT